MTTQEPIEVELPKLGEQVDEATVTSWLTSIGDEVAEGDALFEVSTDKVDSEVPSPVSGTLLEVLVGEGETVAVGTVMARIGSRRDAPPEAEAPEPTPEPARAPEREPEPASTPVPVPTGLGVRTTVAVERVPSAGVDAAADGRLISPAVARLAADNHLDLTALVGTGHGQRITRSDAESAVAAADAKPTARAAQPASGPAPKPSAPAPADGVKRVASKPVPRPPAEDLRQVVPLNRIRTRTAEHMVRSLATAPHALTAVEVDFEAIDRVRRTHRAAWKRDEGSSLTYLPFILTALGTALRDHPLVNGSFVGDGVALNPDRNVAIAVDLDFDGLVAPIVRNVDDKRFRTLAREIVDVAAKARRGSLKPDDLTGGTFTVTNPGKYRTLMQFPIINQPQVAILSTDGVTRKPIVTVDRDGNECIAIHSIGVLALAWDHRAIDGAYAAAFLDRMRTLLQDTDWEAQLA